MVEKTTKKAEAAEQNAFHLYSVEKQGNKKNRAAAYLVDWIFLWLYLAGSTGWLVSTFQIPVSPAAFTGIQGVISLLMILAGTGRGKARFLKIAACCGLLAVTILLFGDIWNDGIHILYNHAVDVLGKQYPYLLPVYHVAAEGTMETVCMYAALAWMSGMLAVLGQYLVRTGNRLLLGIQIVFILLVQMAAGIAPELLWNIGSFLCLLAVWIRGHGEMVPAGKQRLASLQVFALVAAGSALLLFGGSIVLGKTTVTENDLFAGWKETWKSMIEESRYSGNAEVLPEGRFTGLGSLETENKPVLEVTMTKPESYYLRGYTGSQYTGTGWTDIPSEKLWEGRDLFYWLHQGGFYGQECLGDAAVALDEETAAEERNTVVVRNLAGSSKYCYVPYELQSVKEADLQTRMDAQKIGDAGLIAGGWNGDREYVYQALSNQITKYPVYDARLLDKKNLTEAGKAYKRNEEFYNEFVYATYLDIPFELTSALHELIDTGETEQGEKHVDYAEAKQNILYVLTADYTDTKKLDGSWNGSDFIQEFLNYSKKGYSVHFASAAAMMFRYYGIPSRYVEGYLVTPEDVKAMTAGEPYILDDTHAHAWVEYYQDGVGWLPFEVTPSYIGTMDKAEDFQDISGLSGQGSENQPDEPEEEEEEQKKEEEDEIDWLLILEIVLITGICLMLLIMLVFLIWVLLQRHKSRKAKKLFGSADRRLAIRALFEYSMNILSVAGLDIRNTSLYDYREPVGDMFDGEIAAEYEEIVRIRQEAVYSEHEITEEQREIQESFKNKIWIRIYKNGNIIQKFRLKYIYFL